MFFLATADADGHPDCSYKGGMPGFVRVVDDVTLAFPSYDGNGQFRSLGNLTVNPQRRHAVHRLRGDEAHPRERCCVDRSRRSAAGHISRRRLVVRVRAEEIFPNCPRYVHKMQMTELSVVRAPLELRTAGACMEADGSVSRSLAGRPAEAIASFYRPNRSAKV